MVNVLLISTYELGRQPFGLASPAAWLRDVGAEVTCVDLSRDTLASEIVARADVVAWYLPMHTATRLAVPVIRKVRELNPSAHLCCYGLYAPLTADHLRAVGVQTVLGGEFEADLVSLAARVEDDARVAPPIGHAKELPRLTFRVPDRRGLPPLTRYAALHVGDGTRRVVGYTEASRGCKHLCRHCPVVPVYEGRFRVVPPEVVLADVRGQVDAGAQHITFGDPDFFNGVRHAMAVVNGLAREHPGVSYDVTIKVEHLLKHADCLPTLRETGCLFVTSAVESIDDEILRALDKGHTKADFERVMHLCAEADLTIAPTFVAFTPWTTLDGYCQLLDAIRALDLVDAVAPIQLGIRLLIPEGSRLLALPDIRALVGTYDPKMLIYPWTHEDPHVDGLHEAVVDLIGSRLAAPRREVFDAIRALAHERAGAPMSSTDPAPARSRAAVPYLNEPWYC